MTSSGELSADQQGAHVIERLIRMKEQLPTKQRKLCNYLIEHASSVSMLSAQQLAARAEVGISTVMRVIRALHLDSYNELRKALHEVSVRAPVPTWWHLQQSFQSQGTDVMSEVLGESLRMLGDTLNAHLKTSFDQAVKLLLRAKRIYLLGLRSSKTPALYFGYLLEGFMNSVYQLSDESDFVFDRLLQSGQDEVLFVIAQYPFTQRTVDAAQFAHSLGLPIILLTDRMSAPIVPFANVVLKVETSLNQFSILPTVSVIEALVIEMGRQKSGTSIQHLGKVGEVLVNNHITYSEKYEMGNRD